MVTRVAIYRINNHRRSEVITAAIHRGIHAVGDRSVIYDRPVIKPDAEVAVFYGFNEQMRHVFKVYRQANLKVVYIDLGYWDRKLPSALEGYHKFAVNGRHPTAYFQNRPHQTDRLERFNLKFRDRTPGDHILVAGMGDRAAEADGLEPEQWERSAVAMLRKHTSRPIVYRPKPTYLGAKPINGTIDGSDLALSELFESCHAVVTHHSNVAVDGLIAGIPAFCIDGVAAPMGTADLTKIESAELVGDRRAWAASVAYCQFNVDEMRRGVPWRHLKDEGLV